MKSLSKVQCIRFALDDPTEVVILPFLLILFGKMGWHERFSKINSLSLAAAICPFLIHRYSCSVSDVYSFFNVAIFYVLYYFHIFIDY